MKEESFTIFRKVVRLDEVGIRRCRDEILHMKEAHWLRTQIFQAQTLTAINYVNYRLRRYPCNRIFRMVRSVRWAKALRAQAGNPPISFFGNDNPVGRIVAYLNFGLPLMTNQRLNGVVNEFCVGL